MTQDTKTTLSSTLLLLGLLILATGALLPLLNVHWPWTRWIFCGGALLALLAQLLQLRTEPTVRLTRLRRIAVVSALLYCLSGALLFYDPRPVNWIPFLLAGAVLQIYSSWMIEHLTAKEKTQRHDKKPKKKK